VYSHAVLFKVAADCILGEGDRAWETLLKVIPAGGIVSTGDTGAEPFAIPNNYAGPEWPTPLLSCAGWWTATADWALQVLIEDIYGAKADYAGLRIDPCLPEDWTEADIRREFRGDRYHIHIVKEKGISKGRVVLKLDGQEIEGNVISPVGDGNTHQVESVISSMSTV
jgi:cellobiose phosphorylase